MKTKNTSEMYKSFCKAVEAARKVKKDIEENGSQATQILAFSVAAQLEELLSSVEQLKDAVLEDEKALGDY